MSKAQAKEAVDEKYNAVTESFLDSGKHVSVALFQEFFIVLGKLAIDYASRLRLTSRPLYILRNTILASGEKSLFTEVRCMRISSTSAANTCYYCAFKQMDAPVIQRPLSIASS